MYWTECIDSILLNRIASINEYPELTETEKFDRNGAKDHCLLGIRFLIKFSVSFETQTTLEANSGFWYKRQ